MARLDALGVRGARFNVGRSYGRAHRATPSRRSIARVREIGWHMRLHIGGDDIVADRAFLKSIRDSRWCVDHMGHLHLDLGLQQPACQAILIE